MIKILVIGDIMLDHYTIGTVDRISPEAPVPIVKKIQSYSVLGGCGNVIRNLAELECNIFCKTIIGNDYFGNKVKHKLDSLLNFNDHFINRAVSYKTTVKHRIIANHRSTQMIRIDDEVISPEILFSENDMILLKIQKLILLLFQIIIKG